MVSGIDEAFGFSLDGIDAFRTVPFGPVDDGRGGSCSDGDIWLVDFRPGWDDDRNLPAIGKVVVFLGGDDAAGLGAAFWESVGEGERILEGADV